MSAEVVHRKRPPDRRRLAGIRPALAEAIESGRLSPAVFGSNFGCRIFFAGETPAVPGGKFPEGV